MKWFIAWIKSLFAKKDPKPVPTPVPVPVPTPIPVSDPAVWPSWRCDKFMQHGTSGENEIREGALDEAKKQGFDCIRCMGTNMNDEVAVHILHYRSPVDHEFKLGKNNWYNKALTHGVNRWQIQLTPDIAAKWQKLVVDYPDGTVQFLAVDVEAVRKIVTTRPVLQA